MSLGNNAGRRLAAALALALPLSGCMQFEYGIVLAEDLSGTADMNVTVDLEQTAHAFATIEKMFSGEEGAPTEEELAAARQQLREEMGEEEFDEAELRQDIESDLPEGMEVLGVSQTLDDRQMNLEIDLGFENVTQLSQLALSQDDEEQGLPVSDQQPFGDLQIIDEGNTLVIRNKPINPMEDTEEAAEMMPALEGMIESLVGDLKIVFRITTPFAIVEHNATRKDGDTLYWEYGFDNLKQDTEGILVRYRK